MYTCPVCGYNELRYPPRDFTICPSCYTEFGYEDSNRSHRELTREWIRNGMRWAAADVMPPPLDWERRRYEQLRNVGVYVFPPRNTQATPPQYVNLTERLPVVNLPSDAVTIRGRMVEVGNTVITSLAGGELATT